MIENSVKTAQGEEIKIYCSYTELVDIEAVIENPRNPNKHPEKQIKMLSKIIKNQGWRSPIVISNRSGFVVKGHGRLKSAILLGLEKVPIDRQDYANEAEEYADLIADNRISEFSELDNDTLGDILKDLQEFNFDIELTGFTDLDLIDTSFIEDLQDNSFVNEAKDRSDKFDVTFTFDKEYEIDIKDYIKENGKEELTARIVSICKGVD